jgi:hypothetical protein
VTAISVIKWPTWPPFRQAPTALWFRFNLRRNCLGWDSEVIVYIIQVDGDYLVDK